MMKALTHNIQQEREDQRDRSAQLFMWCIVVSMHQDDGIGASRLLRACNEMDAFEKKYQTAILYGSSKNATDAMRENLKGICDFEVRLPVDRAPRGRREEQLRMASNQGAEIAWLVMAATCHETFGYGRDRLARLKQNSMNNYKQYLEWEKEDKDLALDRLRRCVQDALKEDLRVTDTDDRKGMLSTPGRGPSVYETAAVYSEIFRRARAARAVAPLAVYSAAKYDETMTAARKRASVMLGLSSVYSTAGSRRRTASQSGRPSSAASTTFGTPQQSVSRSSAAICCRGSAHSRLRGAGRFSALSRKPTSP